MEQKEASFDIHKYIKLLLRRKWLWIIPTVLFSIGTILHALSLPDVYESKCVLIVERSKVLSSVLADGKAQMDARKLLQAVRERMLGWEPVTQVIRDVGLDSELQQDDIGALERLYNRVVNKINLRTKGEEFIEISYRGENPDVNFGIVNGLVSNFMEQGLKSSRNEANETLSFIEGDLKRLKKLLDESEREFRKFEDEHIDELPGTEYSVLPKFYAAKSELAEIDREIAATTEKLKFLENRKSSESETITGEVTETPNPKIAQLNRTIINLEMEITMLHTKFYDDHPRIIQRQKELARLTELLEEESEKVVTEEKVINNPRYENIAEKEFNLRLELQSLQSHRKELEDNIVKFKPSVENIPELKQKLFELQMNYGINKNLYEERLIQKSKAELVKEMSLDAKSNPFNIIEPARISYTPIKAVKLKIMAMGVLMGAGLGIGLIFGLEKIDPRFKTVDEVQEYLKIPSLGMIPSIVTEADIKKKVKRKIIMAGTVAIVVITATAVCLTVKPVKTLVSDKANKLVEMIGK